MTPGPGWETSAPAAFVRQEASEPNCIKYWLTYDHRRSARYPLQSWPPRNGVYAAHPSVDPGYHIKPCSLTGAESDDSLQNDVEDICR